MNTERLLAAASFSPGALNFPNPWVGHLPFAAWVIREIAPRIFVELGTHTGNSYFAFCQSVAEAGLATRCYAVDTWQGDAHSGEYGNEVFAKVDAYNSTHFGSFSQLLRMTFDQAVNSFHDESIELLHIDGLHTYEAVRHDFETWLPKLTPGAVIIFHDTNIYERGFGVWRFWEELQSRYPQHLSFFHSCGLGVVQLVSDQDQATLEWLQPATPLKNSLIAYFRSLGLHQLERYELNQMNIRFNQLRAERDEQIAERDEQIAILRNSIAQQNEKMTYLQDAIAGRDERIAELLGSTSWRLTRPLRGARRLVTEIIARRGQVMNICRIILGQIRLYGFIGFVRRLPYYWRHRQRACSLFGSQPLAVDGGLFRVAPPVLQETRLHPDLVPGEKLIAESISFIIPTLNAGAEFPWLLRKLFSQRGLGAIEVVIVDSGSTDDTVSIARRMGCTVVEIAPADFSHSYARNIGAEAASGRFLLFMVQDAFPIGSYWAYGMLAYLQEHSEQRLAAVSCAEYSRSDSDMMYDSLINTHYRFLGCLEHDRLGEFQGDDHMSLRANGQLSDVACLIAKQLFERYRYRGDYAEDLDLGIRLIKDGYRVAMMASVKVIHSHNRSAHYYLKRSFVDVVFLTGLFPDFSCPRILSPLGLVAGIVSTAAHLSAWCRVFDDCVSTDILHQELARHIDQWRKEFKEIRLHGSPCSLGDSNLDAYIDNLAARYLIDVDSQSKSALARETDRFAEMFIARLEHFNGFAKDIYGHQDSVLRQQLRDVVLKTFAAAAGASLGFMYVESAEYEADDRRIAQTLYKELKAGI